MVSKRKKRSAEDALLSLASAAEGRTLVATSGSRSSFQTLVLEQQLSQMQSELEHERSMRKLDEKRARQKIERLEKQIELSESVAQEATSTLEDYRETSEARIKSLRESQDQTLQKLRECEIKLLHQEEDEEMEAGENESVMVKFYKEKCENLQRELEQQEENEEDLKKKIERLQEEFKALKSSSIATVPPPPLSPKAAKILEEAPPDLMKELHRIRVALAESQRKERQLQYKVTNVESRNQRLIQEREELRTLSERLPAVQKQLDDISAKYAKMEAEHDAWQDFGRSLRSMLKISSSLHQGPPDISVVESALAKERSQVTSVEAQTRTLQDERTRLKERLETKDNVIRDLERNMVTAKRDIASLEQKVKELQANVEKSQMQQDVYKREAENLRELVKTFDDLPLASAAESKARDVVKSPILDTSKRTLQISLATTKEELQIAQTESERLRKELSENTSELERVKEKFGKLKEALQAERAKAADSEQRANEAEALAGKGSFNPEKSRVVHFTETPLVEALKEEIKVLKRQVEAGKGPKSSSKAAHHNPDKLNQRLKENFKEQIALFREGVYLMTGYKVDMLPNTDRPTFRVRSVYSASEQDHLMLKWPKSSDVSSLDILNTDFAKILSGTPSYQYMTKYHSLPAFLASVQLSLFENTTQIV